MGAAIDITGERFGALVALHISDERPYGHLMWVCQCDCGNTCLAAVGSLRAGRRVSCGCYTPQRRLGKGEQARNSLLSSYKHGAKSRGLAWELTVEQFTELTKQPCYYCGVEPAYILRVRTEGAGDYVYNGIDRLDNGKGYLPDNVVPCCKICNQAKSDRSYEEFINWITHIYNIHKQKESELCLLYLAF